VNESEKWQLLCAEMEKRYPVLASVWVNARERFGQEWLRDAIPGIETMYGRITDPLSDDLLDVMEGYAEFANDAMRSQVFFERHGRYKASSHAEVSRECYHNEEHMNRRYLPGMYLSHYVWPQHYLMLRGFKSLVLPRVRSSRLFFEVGVGCGMYSKTTLQELPEIRGVAFDISQHSLDYAGKMLNAYGVGSRYKLENHDISRGYREKCDFLICQEVLEHLEQPATFCTWLSDMVKPGGHAYITAALNAAHSDHIYLFRKPEELEAMVRAAGFQPLHMHEECAPGTKPRNLTPSLCGIYCQKLP
jgi:SAM-dependent methyltransferase